MKQILNYIILTEDEFNTYNNIKISSDAKDIIINELNEKIKSLEYENKNYKIDLDVFRCIINKMRDEGEKVPDTTFETFGDVFKYIMNNAKR